MREHLLQAYYIQAEEHCKIPFPYRCIKRIGWIETAIFCYFVSVKIAYAGNLYQISGTSRAFKKVDKRPVYEHHGCKKDVGYKYFSADSI